MNTCRVCKESKPVAEMKVTADGKIKKICLACSSVARGGVLKTQARSVVAVVKSETAPIASLHIEQGYGLRAEIDEDYLIVTQHDGETGEDDSICLSRSELRALFERFAKWAA